MSFVFGPVPSRRLGQSLGIDPLPLKICNWNCIYCQLGRSVPMVNERRDYFPREEILAEVEEYLSSRQSTAIDWVTFVGSGETTLHSGIGWLVRQVKALTHIPVAVITNGALLHLPEVREELSAADAVLPTLDAGSPELYRKINRPTAALTFDLLLNGLISFGQEYRGSLWIEVMLIKGVNDSEEALREIAAALARIGPDQVHISLPTRPPAETSVEPADDAGLMRAMALLGAEARIVPPSGGLLDLSGYDNVASAIIGIISRHPVREDELRRTLERWTPGQVEKALQDLKESGAAQVVVRYGERFWSAAGCRYPERRCG